MSVPWIPETNDDVEAVTRRVMREAPQEAERLCVEEPPAYRRLRKLLGELNIDYLNLLPAFREARRQSGVELFRGGDDRHWNPQGHALAARELAAALERGGYLVSPVAGFSGDKGEARFR
jgi:lysophospholipase L1-like esterase